MAKIVETAEATAADIAASGRGGSLLMLYSQAKENHVVVVAPPRAAKGKSKQLTLTTSGAIRVLLFEHNIPWFLRNINDKASVMKSITADGTVTLKVVNKPGQIIPYAALSTANATEG